MSDTPRTDALWSDNSDTPDELADLSRELERRVVELEGWIGNVRAAYRVFICASSESERLEAIALLDLALRKMGTLGFPMSGGAK